jgi:ribosome-associated toxin RatA of RatAB toxin-antitoxin module
MPIVTTRVELAGLKPEDVWPTLVDFERYPLLMQDVVSVDILQRDATTMLSSWKVLLNGSEFTWIERDILQEPYVIRFVQTEGDLEIWQGEWRLDPTPAGLVAVLSVEFDIGIPSMAEILDPIGERAIRANSRQMLDAVRDDARTVIKTIATGATVL